MNKCKYMKCNKEVADGQKYCKFHQQKRKIKKNCNRCVLWIRGNFSFCHI
ncbi:MAG: hypothetical protein ACLS90_06155 [Clostridia bacterium]